MCESRRTMACDPVRAAFFETVRACPDCDNYGNVDHGDRVTKCELHDWKAIRNA